MAQITAFAGEKGGGSKSTTTENMGVQLVLDGMKVKIFDADPQRTTAKWAKRRLAAGILPVIDVEEITAKTLPAGLERCMDNYDHILIDTGGADSSEMRVALLYADIVVCPCEPSQADVETLEHVNEVIGKSLAENPNMRAYVVITKASTNAGSSEVDDMRELAPFLEHMPMLETVIHSRKVFKDALREGRGVVEMPRSKFSRLAIEESTNLQKEIFK